MNKPVQNVKVHSLLEMRNTFQPLKIKDYQLFLMLKNLSKFAAV